MRMNLSTTGIAARRGERRAAIAPRAFMPPSTTCGGVERRSSARRPVAATASGVRTRPTVASAFPATSKNSVPVKPGASASTFTPERLASCHTASEKLSTNAGWSYPPIDMEYMLGYSPEIQDFVAAVAEDRPPVSDGALGRAVVEAIYAGYLSAEEGRRVELRSGA